MDVLENIIGRGTIFAQFLVGEDWDQDLDEVYDYYTSPLME